MVANVEKTLPKTDSAASISTFASFNFSGLAMMQGMVMPMILIFTFANALAPTIAEGGSKYKFMYNLAVTATISGLAMLVLPSLAGVLFSGVKA
jgi:archaellum biogenesis protein FlaJ (TadC family)